MYCFIMMIIQTEMRGTVAVCLKKRPSMRIFKLISPRVHLCSSPDAEMCGWSLLPALPRGLLHGLQPCLQQTDEASVRERVGPDR
jgi:hypothetical protein